MKDYDPKAIETKWQQVWEDNHLYTTPDSVDGKENKYVLVEFSYPSGNLHVGHWYAFAVPDIYARYNRMQGKNVMYPMGFDAFGLPAENAAIKNNKNPREWTFDNIDYMRKQLKSMGASFDWSREVITASPEYYKWTQWLFLKFLEKGLAYQGESTVNWCPTDKTVLANEQVTDGKCERCGSEVEERKMRQWHIKITDYAERLLEDLENLDWPKSIKEAQKNWIGKKDGAVIKFGDLEIFTTRPDTIFGVTFVAVAGEKDRDTGRRVKNPATGEEIPVWEAEYVMKEVGTGAIMGVPSDDERDRVFALKYNLPIVEDYPKAGFEDFGKKVRTYKLHDWTVSRQRYWGCPIPVIHCEKCGAVPVPEADLPVVLPEVEDYLPSDEGKSPLSKAESWVNVSCPQCGGEARRETDTLDTFVDSSWYFLRYADPKNESEFASKDKLEKWMPVNFYSGGAEHTTMHLLYSRFFHKVLFDLGLVNEKEPYVKRMNRGLIMGPDGQKMSKRWGNVVDPDEEVKRFGADTVRTYLAFIGPYNEVGAYPWNTNGVVGVRRFIEKVWRLRTKISNFQFPVSNQFSMNQCVKKVTEEIESLKMNTAVSALMIWVNDLEDREDVSKEEYETLLKLLAPFAPHVSEELWQSLGNETSIHTQMWPTFDLSKLESDSVRLTVQVNGKVRGSLEVRKTKSEEEIEAEAQALPEVSKWLEGKQIKNIIHVKDRVVNIVLT